MSQQPGGRYPRSDDGNSQSEQYPLQEQYLNLQQQELREMQRRGTGSPKQSNSYGLPLPATFRRMASSSQPLSTFSKELRRALPVSDQPYSISPTSASLFTGEPSSYGSRISSQASQLDRCIPEPPINLARRHSVGQYSDAPRVNLSRSVPTRSMSEQPRQAVVSEMSTSLPTRGMAIPYESSVSGSSFATNPLFGSHPSGDPSYYVKRPVRRRMSESMASPSRSPYSTKQVNSRLTRIEEPSTSEAETSSSMSSGSETETSSSSSEQRRTRKKGKGKGKVRTTSSKSTRKSKSKPKRKIRITHPGSAYVVLGVQEDASQSRIRRVYRALIDALEAKLATGASEEVVTAIMEKIVEIKKAYTALSSEKLRAKYDRYLAGSSPSSTSDDEVDKKEQTVTAQSSYYDVIGIQRDAEVDEIKQAAQDMINWHHSKMENAVTQEEYLAAKRSEDMVQRIWKTLGDAEAKKRYDQQLKYGADYEEEGRERLSVTGHSDRSASSRHHSPKSKKATQKEETSSKGPRKSGRQRSGTTSRTKDGRDKDTRKGKERSRRD